MKKRAKWLLWVLGAAVLALTILAIIGIVQSLNASCWLSPDWETLNDPVTVILTGILGGLLLWRTVTADRQADTAAAALDNARYTDMMKLLVHEEESVRIGAVYALSELAEERPHPYYKRVMDVFCAVLRSRPPSGTTEDGPPPFPADRTRIIDEAFRRLRAKHSDMEEGWSIDLQGAWLQGANMREADLQKADLQGAWLQGAKLQGAKLQGAKLQGAKLQRAWLIEAKLQGADLLGAKLQGAWLSGANLQRADLQWANLQRAELQGADLQGANMREADLQGADLLWACVQGTDFTGAENLEELPSNCWVWGDAPDNELPTMPDGTRADRDSLLFRDPELRGQSRFAGFNPFNPDFQKHCKPWNQWPEALREQWLGKKQ